MKKTSIDPVEATAAVTETAAVRRWLADEAFVEAERS
jgi:hypothetical protein